MRRTMEWLLLSIVTMTALAIAGVQMPPRIRALFPVPLAYGLLGGWILGRFANRQGIERSRGTLLLAGAMLACGLTGYTIAYWQKQVNEWRPVRAQELRDEAAERIAQAIAARELIGAAEVPDDPESAENHRKLVESVNAAEADARASGTAERVEQQLQRETAFWHWIGNRQLKRGRWSAPWPTVFTVAEFTLALLAGCWIVYRTTGNAENGSPVNDGLSEESSENPQAR